MTKEELLQIKGGTTTGLSAAFLNSITRFAEIIIEIGQLIGSSIRRISEDAKCQIK